MNDPGPRTRCPICGAASAPYCTKTAYGADWHIARCQQCGHGFVTNRPSFERLVEIYTESDLDGATGIPTQSTLAQAWDARGFASDLARYADLAGQRALDVGSGSGSFSYHLAKRGMAVTMLDVGRRAEQVAHLVPGSTFRHGLLEDYDGPGNFRAIVMSQVLEHALDPMKWLARAAELLAPGGILGIAVPNFAGVYCVLGAHDPFICPPIHLNYFTATSLRQALAARGLTPVQMCSVSIVGDPSSGHLSGTRQVWNRVSRILDRTSLGIILRAYARKPMRTVR